MMKFLLALVWLSSYMVASAQTVQNFTLTNVADGGEVSLYGFNSCQGVAIIFTSNECPYDVQYRDNIKLLNESYKGSIQFLMINSHLDTEENAAAMAKKFQAWEIAAPYLSDKDQIAMECLGATRSPEAFLLKKEGREFSIVYAGAINDNPLVDEDVDNRYLRNAIDQLLKGERIKVARARSAGCTIRKKQ